MINLLILFYINHIFFLNLTYISKQLNKQRITNQVYSFRINLDIQSLIHHNQNISLNP